MRKLLTVMLMVFGMALSGALASGMKAESVGAKVDSKIADAKAEMSGSSHKGEAKMDEAAEQAEKAADDSDDSDDSDTSGSEKKHDMGSDHK